MYKCLIIITYDLREVEIGRGLGSILGNEWT